MCTGHLEIFFSLGDLFELFETTKKKYFKGGKDQLMVAYTRKKTYRVTRFHIPVKSINDLYKEKRTLMKNNDIELYEGDDWYTIY